MRIAKGVHGKLGQITDISWLLNIEHDKSCHLHRQLINESHTPAVWSPDMSSHYMGIIAVAIWCVQFNSFPTLYVYH